MTSESVSFTILNNACCTKITIYLVADQTFHTIQITIFAWLSSTCYNIICMHNSRKLVYFITIRIFISIAQPKLSTNDDIMARFLEQANRELAEEVDRENKRKGKNKPRKDKTPQQTPRPSNKSEDYPVYRLAPHKHITGMFL